MAENDELEAEKSGITEVTDMEIRRADGVRGPANGTPFLFMKSLAADDDDAAKGKDYPKGDQGIDTDDDQTADVEEAPDKVDDDEEVEAKKSGVFCGDDECEVCAGLAIKGKLKSKQRDALPESDFALPGRKYPIHDKSHARNALSRVSQNGTPQEKRKVRSAVARRYPGIGKPKGSMKSTSDQLSQTREVHGDREGARTMDTGAEGSRPSSEHYNQPRPAEHDGGGDTAPDKELPREAALAQTRGNARKSESEGAERPQAVHNEDIGGDKAGAGDDAQAKSEAQGQTAENQRRGGSGMTAEEEAAMAYARKSQVEIIQAAAGLAGVDLEGLTRNQAQKALRQARRLFGGLAEIRRLPHPTQELDDMTSEELLTLLDERDARKAKAAKKAQKKAAKKAAKTASAVTSSPKDGGEVSAEAAPAAKSETPVIDVDGIAEKIGEAVKAQLSPLAQKVSNLEDQPARPRLAANDHAGQAIRRDAPQEGEAKKGLDDLEDAFKSEKDAEKKAKLGAELTTARLMIQSRTQYGTRPAPSA